MSWRLVRFDRWIRLTRLPLICISNSTHYYYNIIVPSNTTKIKTFNIDFVLLLLFFFFMKFAIDFVVCRSLGPYRDCWYFVRRTNTPAIFVGMKTDKDRVTGTCRVLYLTYYRRTFVKKNKSKIPRVTVSCL